MTTENTPNPYSLEALRAADARLTDEEKTAIDADVDSAIIGADAMALAEDHQARGDLATARRWYRTATHHHTPGARDALDDVEVLINALHTPAAEHIAAGTPFETTDHDQTREDVLSEHAHAARIVRQAKDTAKRIIDDAHTEADRITTAMQRNREADFSVWVASEQLPDLMRRTAAIPLTNSVNHLKRVTNELVHHTNNLRLAREVAQQLQLEWRVSKEDLGEAEPITTTQPDVELSVLGRVWSSRYEAAVVDRQTPAFTTLVSAFCRDADEQVTAELRDKSRELACQLRSNLASLLWVPDLSRIEPTDDVPPPRERITAGPMTRKALSQAATKLAPVDATGVAAG
ncbi:hypothetical protein L6E12_31430 [Actinokineospora sp. PR83]|uniref:hypothetical protein n=1 Tax=Actinokineospora sp. PR83 TaxID=2884908 RepID=UPI001F37C1CA|nr:hypothetical protein [Actinokineospora sp. PR83]MCG8920291.1 hypothetical protein [Actinokineospora sp. PR83]